MQIFLSYHGADRALAIEIRDALQASGAAVWMDVNAIAPGDVWLDRIDRGIADADVVCVLTPATGPSYWIETELRLAVLQQQRRLRAREEAARAKLPLPPELRIVPLVPPGGTPDRLPLLAAQFHVMTLPAAAAERSVVLQQLVTRTAVAVRTERVPELSPFPGLEVFEEARSHFFFGRSAETQECVRRLGRLVDGRRQRWLRIEGPSGTGKSSLARAGLVPAVRRGAVESTCTAWAVAVMRPGARPLENLADALARELGGGMAGSAVLEALSRHGLARWLRDRLPLGTGVVLVVDQLEELFTLATAPEVKARFGALLASTLADGDLPFYLVTTARSDFAGRISELGPLAENINSGGSQFVLTPMSQPSLRMAIEGPAKLAGLVLEDGLLQRILDDARATSGGLPLVSHVLRALELHQDHGKLLHTVYGDRLGGLGGAIAHSAEEVFAQLSSAEQRCAERMLLQVVKIGRGTGDARRPSPRESVLAAGGGGPAAERVLALLSGARAEGGDVRAVQRLLTVSHGDGDAEDRVDLVHEALLDHWTRLRELVKASRALLERREDVEAAASAWVAAGRQPGGLPRGGQLAWYRGQDLGEAYRAALGAEARDLLTEAETAERAALEAEEAARARELEAARALAAARAAEVEAERRRRDEAETSRQALARRARQLRWALVATGGLLLVSVVAGVTAWRAAAAAELRLSQGKRVADQVLFEIDERLRRVAGAVSARRRLLGLARGLVDELTADAAEDGGLERQRMAALTLEGDVAMGHGAGSVGGHLEIAAQKYRAALEIAERRVAGARQDVSRRRDLAVVQTKLGAVAQARGDLAGARGFYEKGSAIREAVATERPDDPYAQRELSIALERLGDVLRDESNLAGAMMAYQRSHALHLALAQREPGNADWQRDASVSYNKIGSVLRDQKQRAEAEAAFTSGLVIAERLALEDPDNADWQRDVSVSLEWLGGVRMERGDGSAAREAYARALSIRERLAGQDACNAEGQRDLSGAHGRLGDLLMELGDVADARDAYAKSLELAKRLAEQDPENAAWQQSLSVSYNRLGDVERDLGLLEDAYASYAEGLKVREKLPPEPKNAMWQHGMFVSWTKVGDVALDLEQGEAALHAYVRTQTIAEALVQLDPPRAQWKEALVSARDNVGLALLEVGDLDGAEAAHTKALELAEELSRSDPANADRLESLAGCHDHLAALALARGNRSAARVRLETALGIMERLVAPRPYALKSTLVLNVHLIQVCSGLHDQACVVAGRSRVRQLLGEFSRGALFVGDTEVEKIREMVGE